MNVTIRTHPTLDSPHGKQGGWEVGRLGNFSSLISFIITFVSAQGTVGPSRFSFSCRRQVDEGLTLRWEEALVGSRQ